MGRIVTQIHISNFEDKTKSIDASALIDTGAAYLTLPAIWRDRLGELEKIADIEVEMADQSVKKAGLYGPVRLQVSKFRKTFTEVLFLEMEANEDGYYEPLVGYIPLEQAGIAVDMLGHRLIQVKRADLK